MGMRAKRCSLSSAFSAPSPTSLDGAQVFLKFERHRLLLFVRKSRYFPHTPQIQAFNAFEETEIWGKTQFIKPVCEYFLAKICLFADAGPHISSKITSNHDKEAHQGSDSVFYDLI
jgi:hypothetical protein